jgi:hypothetical protein
MGVDDGASMKASWMEETNNKYRILVTKHSGKQTVGRPRRRLEDNVNVALEIGCEDVNWTELP